MISIRIHNEENVSRTSSDNLGNIKQCEVIFSENESELLKRIVKMESSKIKSLKNTNINFAYKISKKIKSDVVKYNLERTSIYKGLKSKVCILHRYIEEAMGEGEKWIVTID